VLGEWTWWNRIPGHSVYSVKTDVDRPIESADIAVPDVDAAISYPRVTGPNLGGEP
jgi:hypothetical protein